MIYLFSHRWIFWIISFLILAKKIQSKFEFTNLKCDALDKQFCGFEYCYLKSINRTYKYMSVKVNLYKLPVNKFSIKFQGLKRSNGYVPITSEITLDGCKLMSNETFNPFGTYLQGFLMSHTNINHSCPFNHHIIVEKLPVDIVNYKMTKIMPFPKGNYLLNTTWIAYGIQRANVEIYGTLS
ncbi:uncharacterized protein [Drosophila tropicalis]|uniref:uncharacterized protein n=1 Tax=Drosophila tropicalis TaxID=46794 RepID=UPI0035ABD1F7